MRLARVLSPFLLLFSMILSACGAAPDTPVPVSVQFDEGGVSHRISGLWSLTPYSDGGAVPYKIKVADAAGNPFGVDKLGNGPFPDGYPMPAEPLGCFWQRSYLLPDGTPKMDCLCLVAQAPPDWARSFTKATQPPGTAALNLWMGFPGGQGLYAPCFGRPDRGYIKRPDGSIIFLG